jgi:hypothetical protein
VSLIFSANKLSRLLLANKLGHDGNLHSETKKIKVIAMSETTAKWTIDEYHYKSLNLVGVHKLA